MEAVDQALAPDCVYGVWNTFYALGYFPGTSAPDPPGLS